MRHVALRFLGASLALACFATPALADSISSSNNTVHATTNLAPADEYFGRYHMSILGIRNVINDVSNKVDTSSDRGASMLGSLALTEDAVRDWSAHYPFDPLVPKTMVRLERLYIQIGGADGNSHAQDTVSWMDGAYPYSGATRVAHDVYDSSHAQIVSDDGSPVTASTPPELGMVPGVVAPVLPESANNGNDMASVVAPTSGGASDSSDQTSQGNDGWHRPASGTGGPSGDGIP